MQGFLGQDEETSGRISGAADSVPGTTRDALDAPFLETVMGQDPQVPTLSQGDGLTAHHPQISTVDRCPFTAAHLAERKLLLSVRLMPLSPGGNCYPRLLTSSSHPGHGASWIRTRMSPEPPCPCPLLSPLEKLESRGTLHKVLGQPSSSLLTALRQPLSCLEPWTSPPGPPTSPASAPATQPLCSRRLCSRICPHMLFPVSRSQRS